MNDTPRTDADPAMLRTLYEIKRAERADEAERTFAHDFAAMWSKLPQIGRHGTVNTGRGTYAFAKREDQDELIRPILAEHGFFLSFNIVSQDINAIAVTGTLGHRMGHMRQAGPLMLPPDAGPGRNGVQSIGSSISYAERYLTEMLLNLVRKEADDDGNNYKKPGEKPPAPPDRPRKPTVQQWLNELDARLVAADAPERASIIASEQVQEAHAKLSGEQLDRLRAIIANRSADIDTKPEFHEHLIDAYGEITDEAFTDPASFARALVALHEGSADEAEQSNVMAMNADAIEEIKKFPQAATILAALAGAELTREDIEQTPKSFVIAAVPVPELRGGKPDWPGWIKALTFEIKLVPPALLPVWAETQRGNMLLSPAAQRALAVKLISDAMTKAKQTTPAWFIGLLRGVPPGSPAEFADRIINEFEAITDREMRGAFDALIARIRPDMAKLRKEHPVHFDRVDAAVVAAVKRMEAGA